MVLLRYKCVVRFFDSRSSRAYCDNATKVMCVLKWPAPGRGPVVAGLCSRRLDTPSLVHSYTMRLQLLYLGLYVVSAQIQIRLEIHKNELDGIYWKFLSKHRGYNRVGGWNLVSYALKVTSENVSSKPVKSEPWSKHHIHWKQKNMEIVFYL